VIKIYAIIMKKNDLNTVKGGEVVAF